MTLWSTPQWLLRADETHKFRDDPFLLGVASGNATSQSVVLWTRLLDSLEERGRTFGKMGVPVMWEIADDESMRHVLRSGTERAAPEWAHSVHAEVGSLEPDRYYWYRFTAGGQRSPIGRTRTLPRPGADVTRLRFSVASCQKYENAFYVAYRRMLKDDLDFVMHVGDYIYEGTGAASPVRGDGSKEAFTLEDYRARYALYKSDADLRAAHATFPWFTTWDDHEVANDYAGKYSLEGQPVEEFLLRRAAAYRAYYEHMPLPRSAIPHGPDMRIYKECDFGRLAKIYMLDSRQYRSSEACLSEADSGGPGARCPELFDTKRTKLGFEQEGWLKNNLARAKPGWNLLACGTPMAHVDLDPGPGVAYRRDSWDGYPAARQRFMDTLAETRAPNPVVIDGDIHAFQIANLHRQANDLSSPVIASEITATSISSGGVSQRALDERRAGNPNVLLSDSRYRGYLRVTLEAKSLRTDLIAMDDARQQDSTDSVLASYVVESGKPGPVKA
jgi:alkaline phosphatase D